MGARIIPVADMNDALTTQRSYRDDTSRGRAILPLRKEKTGHLDSNFVEAFVAMIQHVG